MGENNGFGAARALVWLPLTLAALSTSGCMSGPTYGTGVGANKQLAEDVSGMFSITPKRAPSVAYEPRPDLVKPAGTMGGSALPAPQQKLASADNPDWPESPERRRARLRAEATANQDNSSFQSEITSDAPAVVAVRSGELGVSGRTEGFTDNKISSASAATRREEIKKRLAQSKQGDPTVRRYLSEPPLAYRQPSDAAPTDDVGEDEWKKEKRLKAEAKARSGKKGGWFDWLPGV